MSLVSVIIPNYNHAPYLKRRIDSVLNQTYREFEVIILDDCSTDNSRDIIETYRSHPKVTEVAYNKVNSGSPFIQWQKGFSLAKGEIIWIAESDDYADAEFLETGVKALRSNKGVGVAFCDSNVVDAEDKVQVNFYKNHRNRNFNTKKWNADYIINGLDEIKENLFLIAL